MPFWEIDSSRPAGTEKGKMLDDYIREFKDQMVNNLQQISGYPSVVAVILPAWTTAGRPAGTLTERLVGYNTETSRIEVVSGGAWTTLPLKADDSSTVSGGIRVTIGDTVPPNPNNDKELWVDTVGKLVKVYRGGAWVSLGAVYQ